MKDYIQKLLALKNDFIIDKFAKLFINHNLGVWKRNPSKFDGEILIEVFPVASSIIAFSYLANVLSDRLKSKIIAYSQSKNRFMGKVLNWKIRKIFTSFNADEILYCKFDRHTSDIDRLFNEIFPKIRTKTDIEKLEVEGVWIGDLLYDSHLRNYKLPTIDIQDLRFATSLRGALGYYLFWKEYLEVHNVKAIVLSHCVYYESAIILRLAVLRNIPVYQVNATHLYYLNNEHLRAYTEFYYYPEMFKELSFEEQNRGLDLAKLRLQKRFSGEVGVDMKYSTKSAYSQKLNKRVLSQSTKIKILIAAHCFFDSPHPYGTHLFPDFYEWLQFLGMISEKTDYEWYIKTHPDFIPDNIPIIKGIISAYPKFKLIPSATSHLQLIDEGLNFALSVYGTIGFEYAALGIPVIYASKCNPCVAYSFNYHPQSIREYEKVLLSLADFKLDIDIEKVNEFYFMRFIQNTQNWLFGNYDEFIDKIGGYAKQAGSLSYHYFLNEFSCHKHERIKSDLADFIESKEYYFQQKFISTGNDFDTL